MIRARMEAPWLDDFPVNGRKNWTMLFDEHHQPKAAYERIARLARG